MPPLPPFPLPLPIDGPPAGYSREERDTSLSSVTAAFEAGINQRDVFSGLPRCIICGNSTPSSLKHCHIIKVSEPHIWTMLKQRNWIPQQAKDHPQHEPRDGLLLCATHRLNFDAYDFFIRFSPTIRKFIFVNYSGSPSLQKYHNKAIALDVSDRYASFPSLFIIHEMRVRGYHPFQPIAPDVSDNPLWQDWILSDGIFDNTSSSFIRESPPGDNKGDSGEGLPQPLTNAQNGDEILSGHTAGLNDDVIADILTATRAMPSWRACEIEGTSWAGTAEENIQKYAALVRSQQITS